MVDNQGVLHVRHRDRKRRGFVYEDAKAKQIVDAIMAREPLRVITGHGKVLTAASRFTPDLLQGTFENC